MTHTIQTRHIQRLIKNAALLAESVNGEMAGTQITLPEDVYMSPEGDSLANVEHMLCKAISDLRHAADELDAERLSCFGWGQV